MWSLVQLLMALWLPTEATSDFSIIFVGDPQIGYAPDNFPDSSQNLWLEHEQVDVTHRRIRGEISNERLVKSVLARLDAREYAHLVGFAIPSHNLERQGDFSVENCKQWCDQIAACVAFEYATDRATKGSAEYPHRTCQLQSGGVEEAADYSRLSKYENLDTYIKGAACTQGQAPYRYVMVNGDLTNADNEGEQITKFKEIYKPLFRHPCAEILLGLGNHDTYDGCKSNDWIFAIGGTKNHCVGNTMRYWLGWIALWKRGRAIRDVDGVDRSDYASGSWSFAKDEGKYTFLFLQNSFGGESNDGKFYERKWDSDKTYQFLSSETWLMSQLSRARNMGQSVIILTHSAQGMRNVVKQRKGLEDALTAAPILAIISGHIHWWHGKKVINEEWQNGQIINTEANNDHGPIAGKEVLYIGSPFRKTYTDVRFTGDGTRLDFEVFDYWGGHDVQKDKGFITMPVPMKKAWTVQSPVPAPMPVPAPIPVPVKSLDNTIRGKLR